MMMMMMLIWMGDALAISKVDGSVLRNYFLPLNSSALQWIGADGAASTPLPNGNSFWVFGDTLLGPAIDRKRRMDFFLHNSVAISRFSDVSIPPQRATFFWRFNASVPASFFPETDSSSYFWPLSVFCAGNAVFVFAIRIIPSSGGFGFEEDGVRVFRGNFSSQILDDPLAWDWQSAALPSGLASLSGGFHFGSAAVTFDNATETVYLWGKVNNATANPVLGKGLLLAKLKLSEMRNFDFSNVLFFSTGSSKWSPSRGDCSVVPGSEYTSETNVVYIRHLGQWAMCFLPFLSNQVSFLTSTEITGPFSSIPLFEIPKGPSDEFCYAVKIHPELMNPHSRKFVFTYNCNSMKFIEVYQDRPELYIPYVMEATYYDSLQVTVISLSFLVLAVCLCILPLLPLVILFLLDLRYRMANRKNPRPDIAKYNGLH